MTVSEDGTRPRFSADEERRNRLGDEAWNLKDQGKSLRTISRTFTDRGDPISHFTVAQLISEAQDRAKFLDYVGPAQSRAASIGRLDAALERQLALIESHAAALETGEVPDYEKGAAVLDKAIARYITLEQIWVKVTGAAMPTRSQVDVNSDGASLDTLPFDELKKAKDHARRMAEMEETDGLDG